MKKRLALLAAVAASFTTGAFAALPQGVTDGLTSIKADGLSLVDLVWPVITAFVAAAVVMKLFKRFVMKV